MIPVALVAASIGALLIAVWVTIYLFGCYEADDIKIPGNVVYDAEEGEKTTEDNSVPKVEYFLLLSLPWYILFLVYLFAFF